VPLAASTHVSRMKLGVYLPTMMPAGLTGRRVIEWARLADRAGFHVLATLDRPNYDLWEGLSTLAGVATVTERIRLATMSLQLPPRNEVLVAKQAAVIDRLSEGRFELGVSLGGRRDDYEALGAAWDGRVDRFREQVGRIREIWSAAKGSTDEEGVLGPAPVQKPGPPIWMGAYAPAAVERAIELGDGYTFGGDRFPPDIAHDITRIRERARQLDKERFVISSMLYVAIGEERTARDEMWRQLGRYYRENLGGEPKDWGVFGPPGAIAEVVRGYADSGLDVLLLAPQIQDLGQLEIIAEQVLPDYR
jgi:alkanesulfonate monooxygenase SsuD/methylene tetrahydromethanopterin reductase-like flavin-dependent oxidoreductase (luciferase family)